MTPTPTTPPFDLPEVLRLHVLWHQGDPGGRRADLAGANLARFALAGTNLARANLAGADLTYANLAGAKLAGTKLAGADLTYANLAGAKLAVANLADADLAGTNLARANLANADLAGTNLAGANLADADLAGTNLARANLAGTNLAGADLTYANLAGAKLAGAIGLHIASDAPTRLLAVARAALASDNALEMRRWHTCSTTHCISGWAEYLGGPSATLLYQKMGPGIAGLMLLGIEAHSYFYASNEKARAFLQSVVDNAEASQ
jgi:hypothetical protein